MIVKCPTCRGSGKFKGKDCDECGGSGEVETDYVDSPDKRML